MLNVRSIVQFDRSVFKRRWGRFNRDPLKRAAALTRGIAVRSIRKGKIRTKKGKRTKPPKPGRPPRSLAAGHPMRRIFFDVKPVVGSAIVGAVGFGGNAPAPGVHEHGLSTTIRVRSKGRTPSGKRRTKQRSVRFPKRQFMVPARDKAKSKYPKLWMNALKR